MNRLVTRNLDGLGPAQLPPLRRGGRARLLFVTLDAMGWTTFARAVAAVTHGRDDVDAVHLRYWSGGLRRAFSAPLPGGRGWLESEARRTALARWRIGRWLRTRVDLGRFEAVHVSPHKYALGVLPAAASSGTPLSVSLDATVWQEKGELGGLDDDAVRRRHGALVAAERSVLGAADLVVAMSRWAAAGAAARLEVEPDRLTVSAPCAPRRRGAGPRPADGRPTRIVFVGHDWHRKGGPRLLRWHQSRWAGSVELHVCGRGARPDNAAANVVWHGTVPHDTLVGSILPEMDLLVLPTFNDMSPWALAEAQSAGLPVVASAVGGIPEVVLHGTTGFLVAPRDDDGFVAAVERLLHDDGLRRSMSDAALAHGSADLEEGVVLNRLVDRLVHLSDHRARGAA